MRKTARIAAIISVAALTLAGCGERPTDEADDAGSSPATESASTPAESHPDFKACMVSDSGGFDDKSFNQTTYQGLLDAKESLGIQTGAVESASDAEYADNIAELVKQRCNQITTVGYLLGDATLAAAKRNKMIDFSIIDFAYSDPKTGKNTAPKNLKGLIFDTAQPAFLAGYLAAAETENGVVGTFGGQNIPTVTIFMTGFLKGVQTYNEDNDTDVQVLGWDGEEGLFTDDFEDKTKGQQITDQMIQQGADIVMPVAGPAGLGGLQAAKNAGIRAIWVDTDGCESAAEYCDIFLTSVMKGMDVAVQEAIKESVDGAFSNEPYLGTLENGGVGLAPYHDQDAEIDQDVKDAIEDLKQRIISGEISVD